MPHAPCGSDQSHGAALRAGRQAMGQIQHVRHTFDIPGVALSSLAVADSKLLTETSHWGETKIHMIFWVGKLKPFPVSEQGFKKTVEATLVEE